jgi:Glycosyl transferases group 1
VSTMNKTMEYMAYALPSVSFDLLETRVSGGDSVLYVPSGDEVAFANAVERLLDDPELRIEMGLRARSRVAEELDWRPQAQRYVTVFETLTSWPSSAPALRFTNEGPAELESDGGKSYVDLTDAIELRRFIQERSSREHERQR